MSLFDLVFTNSNMAELTNPVPTGVVSNDSGIAVKCNPVSFRIPIKISYFFSKSYTYF